MHIYTFYAAEFNIHSIKNDGNNYRVIQQDERTFFEETNLKIKLNVKN